jgi:hypothetical protein
MGEGSRPRSRQPLPSQTNALAAALSYGFRRRGGIAHLLIWLAGFPVLYVLTVVLTLLISFQVFGLDLVD